jgi:DNA-binding NtrC family response regulator
MLGVGIDELHSAVTFLAVEDEDAASRSGARLLITASTQQGVETLARRIHGTGLRAELPFIHTWACDLPIGAEALREHCSGFLDAAAGGSMLISDVEEMPPIVQDVLLELLAGLEFARRPSAAVRLISGTTVSLLDRVTAGTFSDRLFYRLNVIHLMQGGGPNGRPTPIRPR